MRAFTFLFTVLALVSSAFAVDVQKSVIITYPNETPDSILDQAKKAIEEGGGTITHDYKLIKGFAAIVGEKILENVAALGEKYNALIEENQVVTSL